MKIIRVSNYDHEDYRGNQYVIATNFRSPLYARLVCELLNEHVGGRSEDLFRVVEDDHVLRPDWEP